jgi:Holliday junction resolvase RusA-like endonuclease
MSEQPQPIARPGQVSFIVAGNAIKPSPQGSKNSYAAKDSSGAYTGKVTSYESAKQLKAYRKAIAWAARSARSRAGLNGPVAADLTVIVVINFRRPARTAATSPVGRAYGDVDKLARAVLDGITEGGLIADDRYVTSLLVSKHFGDVHATEVTVLFAPDERQGEPS